MKVRKWPACPCPDCMKDEIARLERQVTKLKGGIKGITDLGTRMCDNFESPAGVKVEGVAINSFRLERAWTAAIAALEE